MVEADESDASFLNLLPVMAVVTNIDADHMETYGHDFEKLKQAFVDFLHRLPFYGAAMLCIDDPHVRAIMPQVSRPVTTYGFGEDAQVRAVDARAVGGADALHRAASEGVSADLDVMLNLPGMHNVLNALRGDRGRARARRRRQRRSQQGAGRIQRRRPPLPALRRRRHCRAAAASR